jgi:hypothetical protein
MASACLYDSNDPCGKGRKLEHGVCVCEKGTLDKDRQCVTGVPGSGGGAADANDAGVQMGTDAHVAMPGESDDDAGASAGDSALGASCSDDAPCHGADYGKCVSAVGGGYCTSTGCKSAGDCAKGYFCATDAAPSYCKRMPTGEGKACATQDDCKSFDASYCTIGNPFGVTCAVPCKEGGCDPGRSCQDFSAFAPGTPMLCTEPF